MIANLYLEYLVLQYLKLPISFRVTGTPLPFYHQVNRNPCDMWGECGVLLVAWPTFFHSACFLVFGRTLSLVQLNFVHGVTAQ